MSAIKSIRKGIKVAIIEIHDISENRINFLNHTLRLLKSHQIGTFELLPLLHENDDEKYQKYIDTILSLEQHIIMHGPTHWEDGLHSEFSMASHKETLGRMKYMLYLFKNAFGYVSDTFVPPLWRFNDYLLDVLKSLNIKYTANVSDIIDLERNCKASIPTLSFEGGNKGLDLIFLLASTGTFKYLTSLKMPIRIPIHPDDVYLFPYISALISKLKKNGYSFYNYEQFMNEFKHIL